MVAYQSLPYTPSRAYRHVPTSSISGPGRQQAPNLPTRHSFHPKQILAESSPQERRWFAGLAILVGILLLWLTIGPAVLKHAHNKAQEAKLNMNLAEADAAASVSHSSISLSDSSSSTIPSSSLFIASTVGSSFRPSIASTTTQLAVAATSTVGLPSNTVISLAAPSSISSHPWAPLKGIFASTVQPPAPSRRINRPTTKPFEPPRPTVRAPWGKVGPMRMAVESARSASDAAAATGGVWVPDSKIKYADPVTNTTRRAAPKVDMARRWKSRKSP